MAELHVNIDGDCSGLIAATDRAKAAIDSMDGTRASASFQLQGVDRAIGDLGKVADARENAGGTVTLGVDSGSIGQAREDLSGLRGDVRAASRDFEAASGLRTFGFSDDGSIRQLSGDLGGVTRGLQSVGVESGSLGRIQAGLNATAGSARQLDSDMGSAARSASSLGASAAQVDQNVSQMGRSLVSVGAQATSSLDGATAAMQRSAAGSVQVSSGLQGVSMAGADAGANMESTAGAVAKVDKALNSASGSVDSTTAGVAKLSTALSGSATGGGNSGLIADISRMNSVSASSPFGGGPGLTNAGSMSHTLGSTLPSTPGVGTPVSFIGSGGGGGGTPIGPFGGGGGGSGPPGGGGRPPGSRDRMSGGPPPGWTGGYGEPESSMGSAHGAGQLAMYGAVAGAVGELIGAGAGLLAVNEAIKATPALARGANQAMNEFKKGVTSTASAAIGEGVPALQQLGGALKGLGQEVGSIGAAQMGAVLGGATQLAGDATSALKGLAPAIGPAVEGAVNLGSALLNGIGSPVVAAGIAAASKSLQDPGVKTAITDATVGVLAAGSVVTQVVADVVGTVGDAADALGGPGAQQAAAPAVTGGISGLMSLSRMFGGGMKGGLTAAVLGASATGVGAWQQQQGQDPTQGIFSEAGGAMLGSRMGPLGPMLGVLTQAADVGIQQVPGSGDASKMFADVTSLAGLGMMLGGPLGALGGALAGGGIGIYQAIQDHAAGTGGYAGTGSGSSTPAGQFPTGTGAAAAGKYGWNMDAAGKLTPSSTPGGGGGVYAGGPGTGGSGFGSVSGPLGSPTNPAPPSAPAPLAGSQSIAGSDSSTLPPGMGAPGTPGSPGAPKIPSGPGFGDLFGVGSFGQPKDAPPPPSAGGADTSPPPPPSTTGGPPGAVVPLSGGAAVLPPGSPLNAAVGTAGAPAAGTMEPPPPPPKPVTTAPMGGGSAGSTSMGSLSPAQVAGLNATLPPLAAHLAAVAPAATQMSSGLQSAAPATSQLSSGLAKVQQSAAAVAPPMQQAGQHAVAATAQMQSMQQQAPAAVTAVKAVAPAATAAMGQAQQQVQQAAPAIGAAAPAGIAAGVTANTSQACDASSQMAKSLANCAANFLGIHSPSTVFTEMGLSTGQGLALGIRGSTGVAVTAVQSAMSEVVSAGKAGLAASSPSKEFQAMGQQAMANVGQGAQQQAMPQVGEGAQLSNTLAQMNAANMPPSLMAKARQDEQKRQQDDATKNSSEAKQQEARDKQLQERGFSEATRKKVEEDDKKHAEIKKAADKRTQDNQLLAMQRAGIPVQPMGPNQSLTPFEQFKAIQQKTHDDAQKVALDKLHAPPGSRPPGGETPGQRLARTEKTTHDDAQKVAKNTLENFPSRAANPPPATNAGVDPSNPKGQFGNPTIGRGATGGGHGGTLGPEGKGGIGGGIDAGGPGAANASDNAVGGAIDAAKKKAKAHSPSEVFFDIGGDLMSGLSNGVTAGSGGVAASIGDAMSGALGSGVTTASNGVLGIASNTGLQVGYQWARGVTSGADSVLKSADFSQISLPQIGSALAKTALGVGGLLGPAGSGGSIPNTLNVTMSGAGTPAATPQPIVVNVLLDGQPFDQKIITQISSAMNALADSIPQQVG